MLDFADWVQFHGRSLTLSFWGMLALQDELPSDSRGQTLCAHFSRWGKYAMLCVKPGLENASLLRPGAQSPRRARVL